jgi:hypothetical protein
MGSREKQSELLLQLREVYPAHASFRVDSEEEARRGGGEP